MITRGIILSTHLFSSSVMAGSFGCKDSSGKLYISKTPCSIERDTSKSGRGYMSEEDIKFLHAAQASLHKKGQANRKSYNKKSKVKSANACFATNENPHAKGESISYRGFRFKCMLVKQPEADKYAFYPIDLIRQCRYRPSNKECSIYDNATKHQLFGQL